MPTNAMDYTTEILEPIFGQILLRKQVNDVDFIVIGLAYHVALFVNPTSDYGYDDRYCMHSLEVAEIAIDNFEFTNEVWFWQKHHNRGLRVSGDHLFKESDLCIIENSLKKVPWNIEIIRSLGAEGCKQVLSAIGN
jgi:hypothetical protein